MLFAYHLISNTSTPLQYQFRTLLYNFSTLCYYWTKFFMLLQGIWCYIPIFHIKHIGYLAYLTTNFSYCFIYKWSVKFEMWFNRQLPFPSSEFWSVFERTNIFQRNCRRLHTNERNWLDNIFVWLFQHTWSKKTCIAPPNKMIDI